MFPRARNRQKGGKAQSHEAAIVLRTSRMIDERYAEVDSLSKGERLKVNRGRWGFFSLSFASTLA